MDPKSRVSIAQFSRGDRGHSSPGKVCNLEALKSHLAWRVSRGTFAGKIYVSDLCHVKDFSGEKLRMKYARICRNSPGSTCMPKVFGLTYIYTGRGSWQVSERRFCYKCPFCATRSFWFDLGLIFNAKNSISLSVRNSS